MAKAREGQRRSQLSLRCERDWCAWFGEEPGNPMVHEPGVSAGVTARLDQGRGSDGDRLYALRPEGRGTARVAARMEPDERAESERQAPPGQTHAVAEIFAGRSASDRDAISGIEEMDLKGKVDAEGPDHS